MGNFNILKELNIVEILEFILLFLISIVDIKKKIISDNCLILLFLMGIIQSFINKVFINYYVGMGIYIIPFIFLYMLEDYFKRELIGFGDIKLLLFLGGNLTLKGEINVIEENIHKVLNYYILLYIISGFFSIFLLIFIKGYNKYFNKKEKIKLEYIPFGPFIIIAYYLIKLKIYII